MSQLDPGLFQPFNPNQVNPRFAGATNLAGSSAQTRVNTRTVTLEEFDLRVAHHRIVPVSGYARASIQATNRNGETWSTASISVEKSVTGNPAHKVAFGTPVAITAVGITAVADITGVGFLHIFVGTTESASGEIQLHIQLDDIDTSA